ncbi:RTA1-domain-containing protein [Penicillium angulare]|uniref:RTA1-domain-containing protein n=1 Tax=Penicillium angulare TaxID=116970 RepID=A0A9W9KJH9_9EURO|nr:RTA1-domain-containing protein [Penicillium angulare]
MRISSCLDGLAVPGLLNFLGRSAPFSTKLYLWIFCIFNVISLAVQAVGGGTASSESDTVGGNTAPGTNTMVAGIVFQLLSITILFSVVSISYGARPDSDISARLPQAH